MSKLIQNKAIAYLLIINLIGSLFVPTLASAMGSETRVLLCTSQGYQWVTIEAEQELKLTDDSQAAEHCMFCLSSSDDHDQAVFAYNYLDLVPTEYLLLVSTDHTAHKDYYLSALQPRAPPFFI